MQFYPRLAQAYSTTKMKMLYQIDLIAIAVIILDVTRLTAVLVNNL